MVITNEGGGGGGVRRVVGGKRVPFWACHPDGWVPLREARGGGVCASAPKDATGEEKQRGRGGWLSKWSGSGEEEAEGGGEEAAGPKAPLSHALKSSSAKTLASSRRQSQTTTYSIASAEESLRRSQRAGGSPSLSRAGSSQSLASTKLGRSSSWQHRDKATAELGPWGALKGGAYKQPAAPGAKGWGGMEREGGAGGGSTAETVAMQKRLGLNHVEVMGVLKEGLVGSVDPRAPLRVVQYRAFARHVDEEGRECIPRSSDGLSVPLSEVPDGARIVVVSHRWLRPWDTRSECEAAGRAWAGRAHPDDAAGSKHRLLCDALLKLAKRKEWGAGMQNVFLWIDYAGIEQDDPELRLAGVVSLCGYIALCDALLIPLPALPAVGTANSIESIPAAYGDRGWMMLEALAMYTVSTLKQLEAPEIWVAAGEGATYLEMCHYVLKDLPSTGDLFREEDRSLILGHEVVLLREIRASLARRGYAARHQAAVNCVAFDPSDENHQLLVSGGKDGVVKMVKRHTGMTVWAMKTLGDVKSLAFSPDGSMMAGGGVHTCVVRMWDVTGTSPVLVGSLTGQSSPVYSVAFSPDGLLLASASGDGSIKLWHGETLEKEGVFGGHKDSVSAVTFSPDGSILASACHDGTVKIWDPAQRRQQRAHGKTVAKHDGGAHSLAFSPDSSLLASGGGDGTISLWMVKEMDDRGQLKASTSRVLSLTFSPDGVVLASGSSDGTVRVWSHRAMKELGTLTGHRGSVNSVAFASNSAALVSGDSHGEVMVWEPKTLEGMREESGHSGSIFFAGFSPDNEMLYTLSEDGTVKMWDPELLPMREMATLNLSVKRRGEGSVGVLCAALSHNDSYLAAGTKDGKVRIFNLNTMGEKTVLWGHSKDNVDCTCYANGAYAENSSCPVKGHRGQVDSVIFSADGLALISASSDGSVKVWNLNSVLGLEAGAAEDKKLRMTVTMSKFDRSRPVVVFSRDGQQLSCASLETVRVWDWPSMKEREMVRARDGSYLDPRSDTRNAARREHARVVRDTSNLRFTSHKKGTRNCQCWSGSVNDPLGTFKANPECPLMLSSDGMLTAAVGDLSVTANEETIYIHRGALFEKEVLHGEVLAMFTAPSKVESLVCWPPFVFAGCKRGELLKLDSPHLAHLETSPPSVER